MIPDALSEDDLAQIEARLEAATPAPWRHLASCFIETAAYPHQVIAVTCQRGESGLPALPAHANADFIAQARTDVERLVAEVRRLRAALAECQGETLAPQHAAPLLAHARSDRQPVGG